MSDQSSSDPLPYTQVDRAVKPKATLLARMINESPQHALGSLVEFWDLNGDPRELEKLLTLGKREVLLSSAQVMERFEVASGHRLEPAKMVALGILEQRGDDLFRVRGMSRYFEPLEGRLQRRAAAIAGGRARAAAGRGSDGRFLPVTGAGPPAGPAAGTPAGGPAGEPLDSRLGGAPADDQPTCQPDTTTAYSGQRTAVSGQEISTSVAQARPRPRGAVNEVFEHWQKVLGHPKASIGGKRERAVKARLAEGYTVEQLKQAIDGCAKTPFNVGQNDRGERYDDLELICRDAPHVDRFIRNAKAPPQPRAAPTGAATAAATDWSDYRPGDTSRELFGGEP